MILKARFQLPQNLTKRKQNDHLNFCEDQLKLHSVNYKCIAKQKYKDQIVIHYETTENLYDTNTKVED
jgi:hypothetical protein